jgi:hypothetical protein
LFYEQFIFVYNWTTIPKSFDHRTRKPLCGIYPSSNKKKCNDTNQSGSRLKKNIVHYFVNRLSVIIVRCFNKSMYILAVVKIYNISIYDIVIAVSTCVDNIFLKMVVLTETCKGWTIKNTAFINHIGWWLKILYSEISSIFILQVSQNVSSYVSTWKRHENNTTSTHRYHAIVDIRVHRLPMLLFRLYHNLLILYLALVTSEVEYASVTRISYER